MIKDEFIKKVQGASLEVILELFIDYLETENRTLAQNAMLEIYRSELKRRIGKE